MYIQKHLGQSVAVWGRVDHGRSRRKWTTTGNNGQQWTTLDNNLRCYMHLWCRCYLHNPSYEGHEYESKDGCLICVTALVFSNVVFFRFIFSFKFSFFVFLPLTQNMAVKFIDQSCSFVNFWTLVVLNNISRSVLIYEDEQLPCCWAFLRVPVRKVRLDNINSLSTNLHISYH